MKRRRARDFFTGLEGAMGAATATMHPYCAMRYPRNTHTQRRARRMCVWCPRIFRPLFIHDLLLDSLSSSHSHARRRGTQRGTQAGEAVRTTDHVTAGAEKT